MSEYMRALRFKNEDRPNDALTLFRELLETQVLHDVSKDVKDEKDNKLFYIKYNCYKNLGFIYAERGDQVAALDSLLSVSRQPTDISSLSYNYN